MVVVCACVCARARVRKMYALALSHAKTAIHGCVCRLGAERAQANYEGAGSLGHLLVVVRIERDASVQDVSRLRTSRQRETRKKREEHRAARAIQLDG